MNLAQKFQRWWDEFSGGSHWQYKTKSGGWSPWLPYHVAMYCAQPEREGVGIVRYKHRDMNQEVQEIEWSES